MAHGNSLTPQSIKNLRCGPRRSVAPLLQLVDTEGPAFARIADALQDMVDAGVELTEETVTIAVKIGKQKHAAQSARRITEPDRRAIVYYIRRGDLIKIGTTVDPANRLGSLMPDEILAFEPGDRRIEQQRHRQFEASRVAPKSEYFRQDPVLLAHVAKLLQEHGAPDPAWPSVATLGTGYRRTKARPELPEPAGDAVTAAEAAKTLGMNKGTIYGWARRGTIAAAGADEKGAATFYLNQIRFLIQHNRAAMNHQKWRTA
ncbi:GIY-YIG nuclease family protein [Streptomyces sp900105755]|uniref:GIY-YIG nuclease family protein n=1 Tax=Streptomyces sp. 900105755 TaxID=3154389 RepID=UPI003326126E